tara:strand:+ start:277 stop:522 length:246 start_codon:yes stop_codon:yes gene_type:complete
MTKMKQAWKILSSSADREEHNCVLCNIKFFGFGHNPEPLADKGRCCDACNNKVTYRRLCDVIEEDKAYEREKRRLEKWRNL